MFSPLTKRYRRSHGTKEPLVETQRAMSWGYNTLQPGTPEVRGVGQTDPRNHSFSTYQPFPTGVSKVHSFVVFSPSEAEEKTQPVVNHFLKLLFTV